MLRLLFIFGTLFLAVHGDTLRAATASGWGGYVGTEMRAEHMANDATYKNKAAEQYNMAVAEYECKIGSTQRNKDSFTWTECDTIHDWATSNDNQMEFRFHALIWGIWNPTWLQDNWHGSGAAYLRGVMSTHIQKAFAQYPNVKYWDVVNEAIRDPGDLNSNDLGYKGDVYKTVSAQLGDNGEITGYVANRWMDINSEGGDYVKEAFNYAAQYRSSSNNKLFYNDYNILDMTGWMEKKATAVYNMIKGLKQEDNVPIDGIGFQSHLLASDQDLDYQGIKDNFDRFAALGLEIQVTEIDVQNPNNDNDRLSEIYKMVLDACMDTSACTAFVSWGYTDRYTWIKDGNYPLPFDSDLNPKPVVSTLITALRSGEGSSSSSSGSSGSSSSGSSSGGSITNWEDCSQYWYAFAVDSSYWISKIEVQGSNWGNTWASCEYQGLFYNKHVWGCGRVNTLVFTSLPLNVRLTDRDGQVSNSYYMVSDLNEGSTFYLASFSSGYTEDDNDGFLADSNYTAAEIIVIIIFVLIGLGCIGIIGYFVWKKYKNEKFDRKEEDKMIEVEEVEQDTPRDNDEMQSEEIEIDVDIEQTGLDGAHANEVTAN